MPWKWNGEIEGQDKRFFFFCLFKKKWDIKVFIYKKMGDKFFIFLKKVMIMWLKVPWISPITFPHFVGVTTIFLQIGTAFWSFSKAKGGEHLSGSYILAFIGIFLRGAK